MKFILYHATEFENIKSIIKDNTLIPYHHPKYSGKIKTDFLYFNIFFKSSKNHPFFKETNIIPDGLLFNDELLLSLLDKTEIYLNPYWSGYVDKKSIKLTKENLRVELKKIKEKILSNNLPYFLTHEILIKGEIKNIKEYLIGIIVNDKNNKIKNIKTFREPFFNF